MAEVESVADVLEREYAGDTEGEAYHGPALRVLLAGVGAEAAAARPIPSGHTIGEIALHVLAWREQALERLDGRRTDVKDDGWTASPPASEAAWREVLRRLDENQRLLVAKIRSTPPDRLAKAEGFLRFVLHHDLYHAGQIGLLRRGAR